MDLFLFVKNVKYYCTLKNEKPTVACVKSGVGKNFINNIESRGSVPSVDRVQLLAQYLGVTVSDLLGEVPPGRAGDVLPPDELALLVAYRRADARARQMVDLALEPFKEKEKLPGQAG